MLDDVVLTVVAAMQQLELAMIRCHEVIGDHPDILNPLAYLQEAKQQTSYAWDLIVDLVDKSREA